MTAMKIRILDSARPSFDRDLDDVLAWDRSEDDEVVASARRIVEDVRTRGDEAVLEYSKRFDAVEASSVRELAVAPDELAAALAALPSADREGLKYAAARIRDYHARQMEESWEFEDEHGNRLGQRITPLERVGVYVPGGQAAYPSSVLMTVVPARVAGVDQVVMTVPTPAGEINPLVWAAAALAGVDEVYRIGGAQAIAALAYGTQSIDKVHKIVGPGGAYVAAAKRLVFGPVGIDLIAGPSEILVVADGSTAPEWVAMDLFSQAEHDAAAQAILLTPDGDYLEAVRRSMEKDLAGMERRAIVDASLRRRGALIKTRDLDEAIAIVNRIAPEHLELAVRDPDALLPLVRHAGAIFVGAHSAEVLGDYVAGPSHVLPTSGAARFSSPLGVYDFQKRSSIIRCSEQGASELGRVAATLARGEGLTAHARAAEYRIRGFHDNS